MLRRKRVYILLLGLKHFLIPAGVQFLRIETTPIILFFLLPGPLILLPCCQCKMHFGQAVSHRGCSSVVEQRSTTELHPPCSTGGPNAYSKQAAGG